MSRKESGKITAPVAREGETLTPSAPPVRPVRNLWLMLVMLGGFALLAVTMIVLRPTPSTEVVSIVEGDAAEQFGVNRGEVIDAIADQQAVARTGYRYRVRIDEETDDRAAGIARIGGLVTFIPDARLGQILQIELTSVRPRVANGVIVKVDQQGAAPRHTPPPAAVRPAAPPVDLASVVDAAAATADDVQPGTVFRVRLTEQSRRNPDTEAIARIGGLVVFVPHAKVGDQAIVRIVDRRERMAFSRVISIEESAKTGEEKKSAPMPAGQVLEAASSSADDAVEGRLFNVVIASPSRNNPDTEGVAYIGGLVVIVAGAREGEQHVVRIVDRRARVAFAEIVPPAGE